MTRETEALLMFGDVNELVRVTPIGEIIRFGAAAPDMAAMLKKINVAVQKNVAPIVAPLGGKLTVKAPTKPASSTVKVTAPKLPQPAPVATKPTATASVKVSTPAVSTKAPAVPKPAPVVTKPTPAAPQLMPAGMAPPTAAQQAESARLSAHAATPAGAAAIAAAAKLETSGGKSTPKPAPASTAPAVKVASTALQGNFLEPGGAPLPPPNVQATYVPGLTSAPLTVQQREANAAALLKEKTLQTAAANAQYLRDRQKEEDERAKLHAHLMATDPAYAARDAKIHSAGLDVGQIVMGAKVLAIGASIIASGGAAAGAVGLTGAGTALASAAAADRLVAAVEKGAELGKQAKGVIDEAKAAAAKGDAAARQAVSVLNTVAKERIEKAIPKGVEQTLTASAKKAFDTVAGAVSSGLAEKVLANLRAASAAQAAAPPKPPGSGYVTTPLTTRPPTPVVANTNQQLVQTLASIDLGTPRPRWFVSDAGVLANLYKVTPPPSRGWVVWNTGEVVRQ